MLLRPLRSHSWHMVCSRTAVNVVDIVMLQIALSIWKEITIHQEGLIWTVVYVMIFSPVPAALRHVNVIALFRPFFAHKFLYAVSGRFVAHAVLRFPFLSNQISLGDVSRMSYFGRNRASVGDDYPHPTTSASANLPSPTLADSASNNVNQSSSPTSSRFNGPQNTLLSPQRFVSHSSNPDPHRPSYRLATSSERFLKPSNPEPSYPRPQLVHQPLSTGSYGVHSSRTTNPMHYVQYRQYSNEQNTPQQPWDPSRAITVASIDSHYTPILNRWGQPLSPITTFTRSQPTSGELYGLPGITEPSVLVRDDFTSQPPRLSTNPSSSGQGSSRSSYSHELRQLHTESNAPSTSATSLNVSADGFYSVSGGSARDIESTPAGAFPNLSPRFTIAGVIKQAT